VLTLLLAPAKAVPGAEQPAAGASLEFNKEDGTLYIDWSGPIVGGMADDLRAALDKYGTVLHRVVLFLNSAGGQVQEGDRVIEVLDEIKLRHQLITVVPHGKLCASMCIPIFLQGQDRLAARASLWIFHEAAQRQANGEPRTDTAETWRLFRKYYAPAGVCVPKIRFGTDGGERRDKPRDLMTDLFKLILGVLASLFRSRTNLVVKLRMVGALRLAARLMRVRY
jgi:hypothetical protein